MQKTTRELNLFKESIAVYYPDDPLEKAIQDTYHKYNEGWLSAYQCKLMAKALLSLKTFDQGWFIDKLLPVRMSYFFSPLLTKNTDTMVFVTHFLFLRDILENQEINSYLNDPIVFMTAPLAHWLFREYSLHIFVNKDVLCFENKNISFSEVGGLLIAEKENVLVTSDSIIKIINKTNRKLEMNVDIDILNEIQSEVQLKAASVKIAPGIFKLDADERMFRPDMKVYDKISRKNGKIKEIGPGESGNVLISYGDSEEVSITKKDFDERFIVL